MSDSAAPITAMHKAKACSTLPIFLQIADLHRHVHYMGKALDHALSSLMYPLHASPVQEIQHPQYWCDKIMVQLIGAEHTL